MPKKKNISKVWNRKSNTGLKKCQLEIKTSDQVISCVVPVVEVGIKRHITVKGAKVRSVYKIASRVSVDSQWEVLRGPVAFSNPNKLVNASIRVTNGRQTFRGVIVKASIDGGGTVSPPTKDGLPDVDE